MPTVAKEQRQDGRAEVEAELERRAPFIIDAFFPSDGVCPTD